MADTGWVIAGRGRSLFRGAGGTAWSGLANITADDAAYALVTLAAGAFSQWLTADQFDFSSIPSGATILGIETRFQLALSGQLPPIIDAVNIAKDDTTLGTQKTPGTSLTLTPTDYDFGSASDLWGLSLTAAEVKASTFQLRVSLKRSGAAGNRSGICDTIWCRVTYDLPPSFVPPPQSRKPPVPARRPITQFAMAPQEIAYVPPPVVDTMGWYAETAQTPKKPVPGLAQQPTFVGPPAVLSTGWFSIQQARRTPPATRTQTIVANVFPTTGTVLGWQAPAKQITQDRRRPYPQPTQVFAPPSQFQGFLATKASQRPPMALAKRAGFLSSFVPPIEPVPFGWFVQAKAVPVSRMPFTSAWVVQPPFIEPELPGGTSLRDKQLAKVLEAKRRRRERYDAAERERLRAEEHAAALAIKDQQTDGFRLTPQQEEDMIIALMLAS